MSLLTAQKNDYTKRQAQIQTNMSKARKHPYDRWKNIDPEKLKLQNVRERQKRIKPGECLKYVRVLLHTESVNGELGPDILQKLVELGVQYDIQAQLVPRTICWERSESQTFSTTSNSYVRVLLHTESVNGELGPDILQKLVELGVQYDIQAQLVPRTICWERSESQTFSTTSNSYVRVLLHTESVNGELGPDILQKLVELGVQYDIQAQLVPRTICWERSESQTFSTTSNSLKLTDKCTREPHVVCIMHGEEVAEAIKNKSLQAHVKSIKDAFPNSNVTLLIFGLKKYCRQESIKLKRYDIEKCLTEIQILYECSHRLLETAAEIGIAIAQFSKAIAEIPFKKQQADKYADVNLYLLNDNKDCVRVEGTAGLSRLWQQHLTRLPLVTLETAEAIMYKYPRPKLLFEAYDTTENGKDLLANLKVRRAGGPLTTDRRIGTELSRKIHTLYTFTNPNEKL